MDDDSLLNRIAARLRIVRDLYRKRGVSGCLAAALRHSGLRLPFAASLARAASAGFFLDHLLLALTPVALDQAWPERVAPMRALVRDNFSAAVRALEIGTWFGKGSTRIWLGALPVGSTLTLLDAWAPYLSEQDLRDGDRGYAMMNELGRCAIASALNEIYRHEGARASVTVQLVRARASRFVDYFKDESFDFIFIDGSHYYADVKADIANSKRLLNRTFGVLCGDDLDVPYSAELADFARQNLARDFMVHPSGVAFHPGVMLAVHEELGAVNQSEGFWWTFLRDGKWTLDP